MYFLLIFRDNGKMWSVLLFHLVALVIPLQINFSFANSIRNSSLPISFRDQNGTEENEDICTSPACNFEADKMKSYIDQSIDPCENFYAFACGGFIQNTKVPKDKMEVTQFSILEDKVLANLKLLFEEPIFPQETYPYSVAKTLYKSCMDLERLESLGFSPLLNILEGIGGWPVLLGNDWKPHLQNWTEYAIWLKDAGLSKMDTFLKISEEPDLYNVSNKPITIDRPTLSISFTSLIKGTGSPSVYIYYRYMVDMASEMGAERDQAGWEMLETIRFQIEIANCFVNSSNDVVVTTMSIDEMRTRYSSVPWLEFLHKIFPSKEYLTIEEKLQVYYPYYLECFTTLVNNTDQRTIANYAGWQAVASSAEYLNEFARNLKFEREGMISGLPYRQPRWRECIRTLQETMGEVVGALYGHHYYNKSENKDPFLELFKDLRESFFNTLNNTDWIDLETKQKAWRKASFMQVYFGYPFLYNNETKLSDVYCPFSLKGGEFYDNIRSLVSRFNKPELASFRDSVSRSENFFGWELTANNLRSRNSIHVPATLFQTPFFDTSRPQYLNYAGIGTTLGHEIIHGFDSVGRFFDEFGNFNNWWDTLTQLNFGLRTQCMVDQYNAFNPNAKGVNTTVNGETTLAENIADNWGYKGAYHAYQNWLKRHGKSEQRLGGLNYNPNQLFWIAAAQKWCSVERWDFYEFFLLDDEHTPPEFRVKGIFANSHDFARDFHCLPDQKMNPYKKCAVW